MVCTRIKRFTNMVIIDSVSHKLLLPSLPQAVLIKPGMVVSRKERANALLLVSTVRDALLNQQTQNIM